MKINRILSLFLLCLCATFVVAQNSLREFSVVAFDEKPFDTAARDERYKIIDGNGDLFSIIKLVAATPDDDLRAYFFDFGLPESRVKNVDGEVWVYVQRNAMRVTIRREGFKTVKYDLPVTVQPGQTFEMTLQSTPLVVKKRHLLFQITPVESKAMVSYRAEGDKEYKPFGNGVIDDGGQAAMKLELGIYYYKIISQNYHPSEGRIELVDLQQKHIERVALRPNYGTLTLTAAANADIYIDGEKVGSGSWSGKLAPGNYNVECRLPAHKSSVKTIKLSEGDNLTVQLDHPTPITGILSLTSSPLGATVTIDGKERGTTPDDFTDLLIGMHKITVSKNGYKSATLDVEIKENETTEQSVALEKGVEGTTKQPGSSTATAKGGTINGHEYVDLGLSVKWATCNVGATKPEEYGGYYAWGETEEKDDYDWDTYKWCKSSYGRLDYKTTLDLEDDVAHVKWGGSWRMPTLDELKELKNSCSWQWTTQNGVNGYCVTGPNGNSIFLSAAGYRYFTNLNYSGSEGCYWSGSLNGSSSDDAYGLYFGMRYYDWDGNDRYLGLAVRPVCD